MMTPRLEQLFSFLETSPNDSFITFAIAKEYEGIGELQEALRFYLNLEQHNPKYVGTYYHLGKLYELLEEDDSALKIYTKGMAVAKEIGDHHAHKELAGAKLNLEI